MNDERGTLNDELKACCLQFIVQRSSFIVKKMGGVALRPRRPAGGTPVLPVTEKPRQML
jgi:hypothetical protein